MLIAVLNQKGGSGKSTTAVHTAAYFHDNGYSVFLADADTQSTAFRWATMGKDDYAMGFEALQVVDHGYSGTPVHERLAPHMGTYDVIVVDGPPAASHPVVEGVLYLADCVLVPTIPSPPDLWATNEMLSLIGEVQQSNPRLIARLLITHYDARTAVAREIKDVIPQLGMEALDNYIGTRTAYQLAALHGTSVSRLGPTARAAALDVEFVMDELSILLGMERHLDAT